jgi:hypothetical protein
MWKDKYGFEVVNIGQLKKIISSCNMLMFPQATRLYKNLYRRPLVDVDLKSKQSLWSLKVALAVIVVPESSEKKLKSLNANFR